MNSDEMFDAAKDLAERAMKEANDTQYPINPSRVTAYAMTALALIAVATVEIDR